ncbi:hypothetical protein C2G38_2225009 [Gigaspora rosea]|uniref:Uncharacterized protein n=1 Tax=Gigaspora rosea TaxID=44941 RepID=A0A397TZP3_9GLOM|nr:hypothetical protein C2G38_2225009 [Gigaspora rosea]
MDKNNIEVDVVKTICSSITEEMIMNLEYNNPLLSYMIDFSNLAKEIKNALISKEESISSASKYWKSVNIKFEKETCDQSDQIMAPFFTSSQAKKADTSTCTTKKVYNDKCKLIGFGHDSKNKILDQLIEKKYIYLSDWKSLCNDIRKAVLLLFQAYEAKLKVLILDCPAHPFCHVKEVFNLDIPYKKVAIEEFKLFIQALWAIKYALSDIIYDYKKICEKLLKDYNKIASLYPYEVDCRVRGYQSHSSP